MMNKKLMAAICCFSLCAASLSLAAGCSSQQKETGKETKAAQEIQSTETAAKQNDETKAAGTQTENDQTETMPEEQKTEGQITEEQNTEGESTDGQSTEGIDEEVYTTEGQPVGADTGTTAETQGTADVRKDLMLYITLGGEDFQTYPYNGEETPAGLIQGIADLTGWNLTLADEIYSGKGGISVAFSPESSIFTGPPENQADEFHVFDSEQMTYAILDSVQKTLQNYASSVNPDSVDIWYSMGDGQPLTIDSLGVTLPIDQPYSHEARMAQMENGIN